MKKSWYQSSTGTHARGRSMDAAMDEWNYESSIILSGDKVDPAVGISRLYVCDNIRHQAYTNTSGYCNKKVDELFEKAARETNFEKRKVFRNVGDVDRTKLISTLLVSQNY
jgi:peptide/nickel transport system substrate-binding protein